MELALIVTCPPLSLALVVAPVAIAHWWRQRRAPLPVARVHR